MLPVLNPSCSQAASLSPDGWKFSGDVSILRVSSLSEAPATMQSEPLSPGQAVTFEPFMGTVTQSNF